MHICDIQSVTALPNIQVPPAYIDRATSYHVNGPAETSPRTGCNVLTGKYSLLISTHF